VTACAAAPVASGATGEPGELAGLAPSTAPIDANGRSPARMSRRRTRAARGERPLDVFAPVAASIVAGGSRTSITWKAPSSTGRSRNAGSSAVTPFCATTVNVSTGSSDSAGVPGSSVKRDATGPFVAYTLAGAGRDAEAFVRRERRSQR